MQQLSGRKLRRILHRSFELQNLERRMLLCTLDGTHFVELHGPEAVEIEPNNTLATATPFVGGDALTGSISSSADIDYWVTNLAQGERLRVRPGTDPGQRHYKPRVEIVSPAGEVLLTSGDGHEISLYAPAAGAYYVKITAQSLYGNITGSYGAEGGSNLISTSVTSFSGTTELEPNDTLASATAIGSTTNFRGTLASGSDQDVFSFSLTAGQAAALKFTNLSALNPAIRLYNPSNVLVAADLTGAGLHYVAPLTGTYKFVLAGDNAAGAVTGGYAGTFVRASGSLSLDADPQNDTFTGAVPWGISTTLTRAVGTLLSISDLDLFKVQLRAGRWYSFSIDTNSENMARGGRELLMFNEFGQLLETSFIGTMHTNAATGFGFRVEQTGTHYIGIRAIDPTGLGGYSISGQQTSTFPTQRDIPLVFHDYTGQKTHLGYGPADPLLNPASIPAFIGMFEARYDVYDVDVTTSNPGATTHIGFGAGEFGSIGAYGYGGSFNLGTRRASGDSVLDDSGAGFTSLEGIRRPASVMNQEIGHAAGLYAHARNALGFMAYDSQSALNVVGTYYPFPWTDSRVPDVEVRNEREQQDWILQAGRMADEVEPNDNIMSAQSLNGFLAEMTGDSDPRNDRVALAGRIDNQADLDFYSLTISGTGKTFAIDIDSAEYQHPLDAMLRIFDASGALVASNDSALDRETGIESTDPYLVQAFAPGTYRIEVSGAFGTIGNYRLKLTSEDAFEKDGPRVIASWPNGGFNTDGTRQLLFWINDKLDPSTLTASNIIVQGTTTGVRPGRATFDPTDSVLIWRADAQLPPDTYTVTIRSGSTGVKDLRGNELDGETDGIMTFPEISGNGGAGGDFVTQFTITTADTTPAGISGSSFRRHPYNRTVLTLTWNDELDVQSVHTSPLVLRGRGTDGAFNTADDRFIPIDILYDKVKNTSSRTLEVFTRGVPDFDTYRLEGSFLDAAGNTVNLSTTFSYTSGTSNLVSGPSVAGMSIPHGSAVLVPTSKLRVQFSAALNPGSLTTSNFRLRYSPDSAFFDGNDSFVTEADGTINWDPNMLTAEFEASATLPDGYYMVELNGSAGGISTPGGALLDGEWLDAQIRGSQLFSHWQDTPSGDGFAGGDYRAVFRVVGDSVAPEVNASEFVYQNAPQRLRFTFSEDVSATLSLADLVLENLTTSTTVPLSNLSASYETSTNTWTVTFPGYLYGALPNGQYRATILAAGVFDPAGNAMTQNHERNFSFLMGDADGNGVIDFDDYALIDNGFLNGLTGYTNGDFNYDGVIDFDDYAIIDFNYLNQP
jgi:hypothetical protein